MRKSDVLFSAFIAIISLALVQFFIAPVYTSDDDTFYLLTLSGGFGKTPTSLLHALWGWHPLYGWLVKSLFVCFPTVNWYTGFLLCLHAAGLSAVLYYLLSRFQPVAALLIYAVLFAAFELALLQNPDFTGSALVAGVGSCLLLHLAQERKRMLVAGSLLLLGAFLLRFHIVALALLLFSPLLFFPFSKQRLTKALWVTGVLVVWALLHFAQRQYYGKNIPDWSKKAAFRDAFFSRVNHPQDEAVEAKLLGGKEPAGLLHDGFIYDTTLVNTASLQALHKAGYPYQNPFASDGLKWVYQNNRLYFLLWLVAAALLGFTNRKALRWRLLFLVLPLLVWLCLAVFFKLTPAIYAALFLSGFFYLTDAVRNEKLKEKLWLRFAFAVCAFLFVGWSAKWARARNASNRRYAQSFTCLVSLLQANKTTLFVATNYGVALKFLPAWESPAAYQLDNLLYYERSLTDGTASFLNQHNLPASLSDWILQPQIRLLGEPPASLSPYCLHRYGVSIRPEKDSISNCLPVYRLKAVRESQ